MKKRDELRAIVAAALIAYSVFTALSAQKKLAEALTFRDALQLRADAVEAEVEALRSRADAPPDAAFMEKLARERLGLIRRGELIFYFTDREG